MFYRAGVRKSRYTVLVLDVLWLKIGHSFP